MIARRALLSGIPVLAVVGCSNGQIDPQKVLDGLKAACGIAVPAATVVSIINAAVGSTVQSIVDLICSGYMSAQAAQVASGKAKAGPKDTVHFIVVVNGKQIEVDATPTS